MTAFTCRVPEFQRLSRTMDAQFLNTVANHPDVRPWLGGDGVIDLTSLLANPANIAGQSVMGGFVAIAVGGGRYEVHSLFLPDKGRDAVRAMRLGLDYLFTQTDALELVTKVPAHNAAARGLARLAGFSESFSVTVPWSSATRVMAQCLTLSIEAWALHSVATVATGRWLHEAMDAAKAACGSALGPHSDDEEAHLSMSGAATLMVSAGQARKAAMVYNRWAALAEYPSITVLREGPTVMDLGEGLIVEVRGSEMEVLRCQ